MHGGQEQESRRQTFCSKNGYFVWLRICIRRMECYVMFMLLYLKNVERRARKSRVVLRGWMWNMLKMKRISNNEAVLGLKCCDVWQGMREIG